MQSVLGNVKITLSIIFFIISPYILKTSKFIKTEVLQIKLVISLCTIDKRRRARLQWRVSVKCRWNIFKVRPFSTSICEIFWRLIFFLSSLKCTLMLLDCEFIYGPFWHVVRCVFHRQMNTLPSVRNTQNSVPWFMKPRLVRKRWGRLLASTWACKAPWGLDI